MMTRRHLVAGVFLLVAATRLGTPARSNLPEALTPEQFWTLSAELSEPGGTFRSENLLSNERMLQHVIPALTRSVRTGTAYLGVGPEQNYSFIAALRPNTWIDQLVLTIALVGVSVPNFWLSLMLIVLFGVMLDWLPAGGYIPFGGTINSLIAAADAALAADPYTPTGDPNRATQEQLKNALDALNNGALVVPSSPCRRSFPAPY